MNNSTLKAVQTREQNQVARAKLYQEQAESIKLLRYALNRVLDSEEATPKDVLRAAELLVGLACKPRY